MDTNTKKSLGDDFSDSTHFMLEGFHAHVDQFGRIYFDRCASDLEHTLVPKPTDGDYRRCRVYMQDILPRPSIGKKGTFEISIKFKPEGK